MLEFLEKNYELGYEFDGERVKNWLTDQALRPQDLSKAVFKKFEDGEKMCEQNHPVNQVYLLLSGQVRLMSYLGESRGVEIKTLYAPVFLGDMELLSKEKNYVHQAVVEGTVSALVYTPELFSKMLKRNADFALASAGRMAELLSDMSKKSAADLQYTNHGLLLIFFLKILDENQDIPEITLINLPRSKMSEKTGVAERTLNRVIADFIKRGWLKIRRGKVCLIQKYREEMEEILPTFIKD